MKKITLAILIVLLTAVQTWALDVVRLGPEYFPEPDRSRAIANGYIYVGAPNLDPTIPANQKELTVQQEDGSLVVVSQPVRTNTGGVPVYNGSPVTLLVQGDYSLAILSSAMSQEYYVPSATGGTTISNNVYYPDYTETDQGLTGLGETWKAYIDTIGSDTATIVFRNNSGSGTTEYTLSTALTNPKNVTIEFEPGAYINFTSSGDVTFQGNPLVTQKKEIFRYSSTGVVTGTVAVDYVYPEWFGAAGDCTFNGTVWAGTDDTDAWNAALSFAEMTYPRVVLGTSMYEINSTLHIRSAGVGIRFESGVGAMFGAIENRSRASGFAIGSNIAGNVIELLDDTNDGRSIRGNVLEHVFITGNNRTYTVSGAAIAVLSAYLGHFSDIDIDGVAGTALRIGGVVKSYFSDIDIANCGAANQPSVYIAEYTNTVPETLFFQGSHMTGVNVESDDSEGVISGNLYIAADSAKACKFESFTLENGSETGGKAPLFVDLSENNIFSNFTLNRNVGLTLIATTAAKAVLNGNESKYCNFISRLMAEGQTCYDINGNNNSFSGFCFFELAAKETSDGVALGGFPFNDSGNGNSFDNVTIVDAHTSTFSGQNTSINGYNVVKVSENRADVIDWTESDFDYIVLSIEGQNTIVTGYNETGFAYVGTSQSVNIVGKEHVFTAFNIDINDTSGRVFVNQPVTAPVISIGGVTNEVSHGVIEGFSIFNNAVNSSNQRNKIDWNRIRSVNNVGVFFSGSAMQSLSCVGNQFFNVGDGGATDYLIEFRGVAVWDEPAIVSNNYGFGNNVQNLIYSADDGSDSYVYGIVTDNSFGANNITGAGIYWPNAGGNSLVNNNLLN